MFDPCKVDIDFQNVAVCRAGLAVDFDEDALKRKLDEPDCLIRFAIRGKGKGLSRFWTCDFTEDYIRISTRVYPDIAMRTLLPALIAHRLPVRAADHAAGCDPDFFHLAVTRAAGGNAHPSRSAPTHQRINFFRSLRSTDEGLYHRFARYVERILVSRADIPDQQSRLRRRTEIDEGDANKHTLDLDWVLEIGDQAPRRKVLKCVIEKRGKKWKITALDPVDFFKY